MTNIFITGINGFIGSHLAKRMVEEGHNVIGLIRDYRENKWLKEALKGSIKVRGNITNFRVLKRALNQYQIDWCIHLAAQSIVKTAYRDPIGTFSTNVLGTVKILEACRELDVKRVMIQSSDKVYGNTMNASTQSPLKPTEIYGSSKICADVIAQTFIETYGMDIIITRCCNVFGYDLNNRIIPNTIRSCLRGENPIIYKNDPSKRQYIYIDEAVECFLSLMSGHYSSGPYNVATSQIKSQREVVHEILKHFSSLKAKYIDKPVLKQIHSQSMDPGLNVKGQISFADGVKLTIKAFRKYGF